MITAIEARGKIKDLTTKRCQKEMKMLEEGITKAIENCETFCYFDIRFSASTKKWIKSLGYKLWEFSDLLEGDFICTRVRW